jgi:hypothetical protein
LAVVLLLYLRACPISSQPRWHWLQCLRRSNRALSHPCQATFIILRACMHLTPRASSPAC